MGDWCRQVGTTRSETDTDEPKETTAKGEGLVAPWKSSLVRKKTETSVKRGGNRDREQKSL
jgi:hypothetical protein